MKIYIPTFILLSLLTYAKLLYAIPPDDSGTPINCFTFQRSGLSPQDKKEILLKYKEGRISKATAELKSQMDALEKDSLFHQCIIHPQYILRAMKETPDKDFVVASLTVHSDSNNLFKLKSVTEGNAPLIASSPAIGSLNLWLIVRKMIFCYPAEISFCAVDIIENSDNPPKSDLLSHDNKNKLLRIINNDLKTGSKGSFDKLLVNEIKSAPKLLEYIVTNDERLKAEGNFSTEETFIKKLNYLITQHRTEKDTSPLHETVNKAFEGTTLIIDPQKFIDNPSTGTKPFPEGFFEDTNQIHQDAVKDLFESEDSMEPEP